MNSTPVFEVEPRVMTSDDIAAWGAAAPIGSALWLPVGYLDLAELSDAGQIDALVMLERHRAWVDAQQQRLLAMLAGHPCEPLTEHGQQRRHLDKGWVREEIACALRLSAGAVNDRLVIGQSLVEQFPATLAALEEGAISLRHAGVLVEETVQLDPALAAKVEAKVLAMAGTQTVAQFRRAVKRAVQHVDPRDAEEKHAAERQERNVRSWPAEHGMAELHALGPAEDITAIATAIQAAADHTKTSNPGETRSADQLRFDALTAIACHILSGCPGDDGHGDPTVRTGTWHGRRPGIQVTVALSTLLGLDQQPAELAGYGPITATAARRLAGDPTSTWRRLVTDDLGHLIDYGRSTYEPPQDLKDHIIAAEPDCRFPPCSHDSRRCELDHRQAWEDDGNTAEDNMDPLNTRHHHLKHEGGWSTQLLEDGTLRWTSPTGHTYDDPPHQHPTDHTLGFLQPHQPPAPDDPDEPDDLVEADEEDPPPF